MSEVVKTVSENEKVTPKREYAPHRRTSYRICKECGKMYVLSDNDAIHYISTYGNLPLRCEKCREKKYENDEKKNDLENNE
jgi:hypothetical protein